jgi:Domain of unknown function (DUF6438)
MIPAQNPPNQSRSFNNTEDNMVLRRSSTILILAAMASLIALQTASAHRQSQTSDQTADLGALSDADLKAATIRMERTRCYGNCPAYTVTIHGDGRVEYSGTFGVKVKEAQTGRIEPDAVKRLLSQFAQAKFLAIKADYSAEKCSCTRRCTDMPSAVTELVAGGATHVVNHYYGCGCAPKALFELESAIDKAAQVEQWTGDVSKAGPFGTTCWG